ncbi:hypothetical protein PVL29_019672 [Vitis rotundifolia]|uniref:Uncharacterized protein n=1 Tax=Vitis rotundifolia TaxID=103349 RepID=A0AA38Z1K2_VITRO|nr:hypothetical protein PVL29_019672 [Vitis rotundifolia]
MEQTKSDIKKVLQDCQKSGSGACCEEARMEVLNREIKVLDDQVQGSGSMELECHIMQHLLKLKATLQQPLLAFLPLYSPGRVRPSKSTSEINRREERGRDFRERKMAPVLQSS